MLNKNHQQNLTIVIPCYNEAGSIEHVLENLYSTVLQYQWKVIVVNDGSSDQTKNILLNYKEKHPEFPLRILNHRVNRGYGGALKSGFNLTETEYVISIDADGQHRIQDIIRLFESLIEQDADLCIGNRNFKGSTFTRNLVKRTVLFFVKSATGITIHDLNSGMKLYKTKIVQSLLKYSPNGMPFSDTIVLLHHQFRYKICEQDIEIENRNSGKSTINFKTGIYTFGEVINIVINFFPFKFFLNISIALFLFSVIWGTPLILEGHGLSTGTSFLLLASLNFFFFGLILENVVRSRFENYHYE